METVSLQNYWPYDEVKVEGDCSKGCFNFSTPWLSVEVQIAETDISRAAPLLSKLNNETLSTADLADVTWLFSSLRSHPLSYLLPRPHLEAALDQHRVPTSRSWTSTSSPQRLLHELSLEAKQGMEPRIDPPGAFNRILALPDSSPSQEWKWDTAAALSFAQGPLGHDPLSLFSIARRFHLLESVENNRTGELFHWLSSLNPDLQQFKKALLQILRQNHYVTQKCDSALRPALAISQSAQNEVHKFIRAEAGHDILLARAIKSMGILNPTEISVLDPVVVLMEVFRITAQTNFLAFCMIVDIFERSSDQEQDPLAALLARGGFTQAAEQINLHREINDAGEHENVALQFLEKMAPVDSEYALEALHLAELATFLTHSVSWALLRECKT